MTRDSDTIAFAGVVGQAGMLASGEVTSSELVDLLLARIERIDSTLNAFRVVLAEPARAAAAAADRARRDGDTRPLLGVPIAVKDTVELAGTASLHGTGSPEPVAAHDAELVSRIRDSGLVILGKTQLPELAMWAATESIHHGITRNPWDLSRAPGGSSGGSAAAVAAGLVPAAHATDGLGSIRIPASCCGLVGLKPTHDTLPMGDHWVGLSHAGFLTRSVRDTAALLDAMIDGSTRLADAAEAGSEPLRIAVTTQAPTPARPVPEVRDTLDRAVGVLRDLGHTVTERTPPYGAALGLANSVRYLAGVAADVRTLADGTATERRTRHLAAIGRRLPRRAVRWARRYGEAFAQRMEGFLGEDHLLLMPTMPVLPREAGCLNRGTVGTLLHMLPCAAYTGPWNASGLPAISLPVGVTGSGLPIGVQLVGPTGSEGLLLAVANGMERVVSWADRRVDEDRVSAPLP
jgi:amidase